MVYQVQMARTRQGKVKVCLFMVYPSRKEQCVYKRKEFTIPKIDDLKKHEQTSDHKSVLLARDCAKKAERQKANA